MIYNLGAIVTGNVVEGILVIEPCAIPVIKEAMGYEHLIPVDDNVQIGDYYDEEKSIFLRDGERIYPQKTDSEFIAELKTEISELQDAMIELAGILTESEAESGG